MKKTMKTVCEINKCTGCMACVDICPKNAINVVDEIINYNAIIDETICIGCNVCHKKCQTNFQPSFNYPQKWYQGWASDKKVRAKASSGGIASALAIKFINDGGLVCSCSFNRGKFTFAFAQTVDELNKFTGSKYVKSNPDSIYEKLNNELKFGHKVLFIALPCQVAAMRNYVNDNVNLTTVDLICHGSPSPLILETYLEQHRNKISHLDDILFRKKTHFQLYKKKSGIYNGVVMDGTTDKYLISFLNGLSFTENCYSCNYAKIERISDITIGDSWGSQLDNNEIKNGVSLILCQTEKGEELVKGSDIELFAVDLERAKSNNQQLCESFKEPSDRKKFIDALKQGKNFDKLIRNIYPYQCFKQDVKKVLIKLHIICK